MAFDSPRRGLSRVVAAKPMLLAIVPVNKINHTGAITRSLFGVRAALTLRMTGLIYMEDGGGEGWPAGQ